MTLKEIITGIEKKKFSCQEISGRYLDTIDKKNKDINAFISVNRGEGDFPIAIKDNILVKGLKCTAGSRILENYIAPYNATVIDKLGAFVLGKTNLDEFACGSSGEFSAFGPTKNPNDLEYVAGGSSSGSAAAVAADMAPVALGSDTAGSVRLPASFCGVVGFKPTYGAVSRYGLIAMASSLDQIGILSQNIEDAEIVFDIIKGKDEMDSTTLEVEESDKVCLKDLVFGLPKECFSQGIDKKVLEITNKAVKELEKQGARIEEINMPDLGYGVACYYIIMPAELSANLARYDGVRYGSSEKAEDLFSVYFKTREKYFGKEIKRRIMLGTYALSFGYYEAYYLRALKVRTKIKQDFDNAFEKIDFVLTPTAPVLPFKIGQKIEDPLSLYMMDLLTVPANLAGLPGISLPVGSIGNLPVGAQIIGPALKDKKLLKTAKMLEQIWTQ